MEIIAIPTTAATPVRSGTSTFLSHHDNFRSTGTGTSLLLLATAARESALALYIPRLSLSSSSILVSLSDDSQCHESVRRTFPCSSTVIEVESLRLVLSLMADCTVFVTVLSRYTVSVMCLSTLTVSVVVSTSGLRVAQPHTIHSRKQMPTPHTSPSSLPKIFSFIFSPFKIIYVVLYLEYSALHSARYEKKRHPDRGIPLDVKIKGAMPHKAPLLKLYAISRPSCCSWHHLPGNVPEGQ